jgi:hypothetical protein
MQNRKIKSIMNEKFKKIILKKSLIIAETICLACTAARIETEILFAFSAKRLHKEASLLTGFKAG